jgi:N-acetylglucosamine kinase-like BadF-type ATPase
MEFFAGIDAGQSSTVAVVGDAYGHVLGRGVAGPADEVGQGPESTRLRDALATALAQAIVHAQIPPATRMRAIVAGISGYAGRVYGVAPELPSDRVVLAHDAPIAHAGALGGEPGIAVIAGTGSVVYGTAAGAATAWTLGGWGYLFGDEGSAFWFAREAIAAFMRGYDGGDDRDPDALAACEFFGVASLPDLARAFYSGEIGRDRLASFARDVIEMARFSPLIEAGATALARLAATAIGRGAAERVSVCGGLSRNESFRSRVERAIVEIRPSVEILAARHEPVIGALLLAYRTADVPMREIVV